MTEGKQIYTSGSYPDADATNGYYNGYYPGWGGYYTYTNAIYVTPTIMNTSTPATMRLRTLPSYASVAQVYIQQQIDFRLNSSYILSIIE